MAISQSEEDTLNRVPQRSGHFAAHFSLNRSSSCSTATKFATLRKSGTLLQAIRGAPTIPPSEIRQTGRLSEHFSAPLHLLISHLFALFNQRSSWGSPFPFPFRHFLYVSKSSNSPSALSFSLLSSTNFYRSSLELVGYFDLLLSSGLSRHFQQSALCTPRICRPASTAAV